MEELAQVSGSQGCEFSEPFTLLPKPRRSKSAEDLAEHAKLCQMLAALQNGSEAGQLMCRIMRSLACNCQVQQASEPEACQLSRYLEILEQINR